MLASTTTQIETVSEDIRSALARVNPFAKAPGAQISVHGGLHEGSTKTLAQDIIRIGSNDGSDLVLLDAEVEPEHLSLEILHGFFGPMVVVTASGPEVAVGSLMLEPGQTGRAQRLPIKIKIGGAVRLGLSTARLRKPIPNWSQRVLSNLWRAVLVIFLAGGSLLGGSLIWGPRFLIQTDAFASRPALGEQKPISRAVVEDKLAELGLDQTLVVKERSDGMIQISGRLDDSQLAAWEQVLPWYDSVSHGRPLFTKLDLSGALTELPPISMVRLHEPRMLILANGETIALGERVTGKWRLITIESDHIEVGNGEERRVLHFAEPAQ